MAKFFKDRERALCGLFLAISIIVFGIYIWGCTNISIWPDEVCDLKMIKRPYAYFLTALRDAAPPFHFTLLKTFVGIAGIVLPKLHFIRAAKFSSVLAYLIIFAVSNTIVRKRFGAVAGAMCGLLCMTMPSMFPFGIELRMYAWAVTIAFLWFVAFYEFLENESVVNIIILSVLGALGVFTHYYVVFGVVYAYVFFFILCLCQKRYKSAFKILGAGIGSSVLFSPWLFVAFRSLVKLASGFWLPEVTGADVVKDFFFPLKPDVSKLGIDKLGAVVFGVIIVYFLARWMKEEKSNKRIFTIIGITMPFAVAIIGILIGKFVFTVFQPRYIMVIMSCFWLAIAISVGNIKSNRIIQTLIILFILGVAFLDVAKHTKDEVEYADNIEILCDFLDTHDGVIATDDSRINTCIPYYSDMEVFVVSGKKEDRYDEVMEQIENGETVYLLHSDMSNVNSSYMDRMKAEGVTFEHIVDCGIEYIGIEIFEISKQ